MEPVLKEKDQKQAGDPEYLKKIYPGRSFLKNLVRVRARPNAVNLAGVKAEADGQNMVINGLIHLHYGCMQQMSQTIDILD